MVKPRSLREIALDFFVNYVIIRRNDSFIFLYFSTGCKMGGGLDKCELRMPKFGKFYW